MSNQNIGNFYVSAWEDDLNDVEEEKNPHESPSKEIFWAVENNKIDVARKLLEMDSKLVEVKDNDGYTPLHRASYSNHKEMVELLLTFGADVLAKTNFDWQPLHSACQWNNVDCIIILIQNGADINAQTDGGQTPLHLAASQGSFIGTAQFLLSQPYINPSITNCNNETAYDLAKRASKYYKIFDMGLPFLNGINKD